MVASVSGFSPLFGARLHRYAPESGMGGVREDDFDLNLPRYQTLPRC